MVTLETYFLSFSVWTAVLQFHSASSPVLPEVDFQIVVSSFKGDFFFLPIVPLRWFNNLLIVDIQFLVIITNRFELVSSWFVNCKLSLDAQANVVCFPVTILHWFTICVVDVIFGLVCMIDIIFSINIPVANFGKLIINPIKSILETVHSPAIN